MNTNKSTKGKSSIGKALPFILATMLIMAMLVPTFAAEHLPTFATEGAAGDLSEDTEVSEPSAEPVAPAEETAETTSAAALSAPGTWASDVAEVENFSEFKTAAEKVNNGTIKTINIQSSFDVTETIIFDKTVTINGNGNTLTDKVTATNEFAILEVSPRADVEIKGLNFTGSEKAHSAIHMVADEKNPGAYTNLSVTGGTIKGFRGSALYLLDGNVTLKNVNFTDNNAIDSKNGGAVNAWLRINATIDGCTFTGNSATNGGAIYASNYPDITITNTTISGNTASDSGGAIYAYVNSKVTIGAGTVIENNTAKNYGGAASVAWKSEFILDGGKISGNKASYGGGIMAEGKSIVVKSGEISGNSAVHGGGIYAYNETTIDMLGGKISGNTASTGAGGGIMTAGKSIVVKNGEISENTAANGGGVYAYNGATVDLLGGTFTDNYANFGGAILIDDIQKLTANNVKFENNKAYEGYRWNLDDSNNLVAHQAAANIHKAKILNTTFSTPFTNAYNNYDVYYTFVGKELKYGKIIVEYYSDNLNGTPIAVRSLDKVYVGAEVEDTIITSLGADWLNAQRPAAGFKDGSVNEAIPTILESDADFVIKVLYSELPVEPEVPTTEPEVPAIEPEIPTTTVNITQRIVETFPAEQVAQIEAQTGNPVVDVANGNVPKGSMEAQGTWSLLNLLLAIVCAVSFAVMTIGTIRNRVNAMVAKLLRFAAMVMGMFTIIIWAIIEDLTMPMSWINNNTAVIVILFSVFAIVTVVFNIVKIRKNEKSKGEVVVA